VLKHGQVSVDQHEMWSVIMRDVPLRNHILRAMVPGTFYTFIWMRCSWKQLPV